MGARTWPSAALVLALLAVATACGRPATAPSRQPVLSTTAAAHLEQVVSTLRMQWYWRHTVLWPEFRERVFERADGASTIPETFDAIRLALTMLGDRHSYYITADGEFIFNPQSPSRVTGTCVIQDPTPPALPASVGYVRVRIFLEGDTLAQATAIQDAIRAADRDDLEGWIVDLRNSRGGNMWPALAGIGPVLGTGTAGHFVGIGSVTPWGYEDGRAWLGSATMVALAGPYELRRPMPRVAVLTDIGVSSSGEAIAIAFRGRPNTRSFGAATCGLSTAVAQFPLTNGARVGVVTSLMADRRQATYGNEVIPDEVIGGADEVVARAVAWLVTGADPLQLSSVRQDD